MDTQTREQSIGVTIMAIGLSSFQQVTPIAGQVRIEIGQLTGGTFWATGSSVNGWAVGRNITPVGADDFISYGAPNIFLWAQGATVTASVTRFFNTTTPP